MVDDAANRIGNAPLTFAGGQRPPTTREDHAFSVLLSHKGLSSGDIPTDAWCGQAYSRALDSGLTVREILNLGMHGAPPREQQEYLRRKQILLLAAQVYRPAMFVSVEAKLREL